MKVALITGSSRGIGKAIAKELASSGFEVIINNSSAIEEANKVVDEIVNSGGKAFYVQADVSLLSFSLNPFFSHI